MRPSLLQLYTCMHATATADGKGARQQWYDRPLLSGGGAMLGTANVFDDLDDLLTIICPAHSMHAQLLFALLSLCFCPSLCCCFIQQVMLTLASPKPLFLAPPPFPCTHNHSPHPPPPRCVPRPW